MVCLTQLLETVCLNVPTVKLGLCWTSQHVPAQEPCGTRSNVSTPQDSKTPLTRSDYLATLRVADRCSCSSCSPHTFHRSGSLYELTTDEARTPFLRVFGSFVGPNQDLRWVQHQMRVVAAVRGCLSLAPGRLDGPALAGTRSMDQHTLESIVLPAHAGKASVPRDLRKATAPSQRCSFPLLARILGLPQRALLTQAA